MEIYTASPKPRNPIDETIIPSIISFFLLNSNFFPIINATTKLVSGFTANMIPTYFSEIFLYLASKGKAGAHALIPIVIRKTVI